MKVFDDAIKETGKYFTLDPYFVASMATILPDTNCASLEV